MKKMLVITKCTRGGVLLYASQLFANDEKTLYKMYKEYPSIFTKHYKALKRVVYDQTSQEKNKARSYLALRCPRSRIDGMGGQVSEFI
jgi:hypothetical protein